jgi:hypothetical protein
MTLRNLTGRWFTRGFILAAALAVAACSNPYAEDQPTRAEIISGGWVGPTARPPSAVIYCYRTLATPDCRKTPEPGQEDRLVSYDGGDYASPPQ